MWENLYKLLKQDEIIPVNKFKSIWSMVITGTNYLNLCFYGSVMQSGLCLCLPNAFLDSYVAACVHDVLGLAFPVIAEI